MNWSQAGLLGFALYFLICVGIVVADGCRRRANARWGSRTNTNRYRK